MIDQYNLKQELEQSINDFFTCIFFFFGDQLSLS